MLCMFSSLTRCVSEIQNQNQIQLAERASVGLAFILNVVVSIRVRSEMNRFWSPQHADSRVHQHGPCLPFGPLSAPLRPCGCHHVRVVTYPSVQCIWRRVSGSFCALTLRLTNTCTGKRTRLHPAWPSASTQTCGCSWRQQY